MLLGLQRASALAGLGLVLGAAVAVSHAEIAPLTRERLTEAEEFGRRSVKDDKIIHKTPAAPRGSTFTPSR